MTLDEALDRVALLKPHPFDRAVMADFVTELDGRLCAEMLREHPGLCADALRYDPAADGGKVLLVPAPYDGIYLYWLFGKIDGLNGEFDRANNDALLFNEMWQALAAYLNRIDPPGRKERIRLM